MTHPGTSRLGTASVDDPPATWVDDGGPRPTARWGVLAVRPALLDATEAYAAALAHEPRLSTRHRRIAMLAVTRRSPHELAIHRARAVEAGITDDELEAIADEHWTAECFDDADRAVFRFAMMFDAGHGMSDAVVETLRLHLDPGQVVELCLTCAHAGGLARLAIALDLQLDTGGTDDGVPEGVA